jgi:microcystin-dependent protein
MVDFYVGQIFMGGWNFAPTQSALCNGQILSISQNQALFALIGTTYGGNGTSTFALPNLQGRVPIHQGQSPGTSNYVIGQSAGSENETLLLTNMPQHTHTATFTSSSSFNVSGVQPHATSQVAAAGFVLGHSVDITSPPVSQPAIYCPAGTAATIALGGLNVAGTVTVGNAGGSQPFPILQPYLTINFCIALFGIFPSRN